MKYIKNIISVILCAVIALGTVTGLTQISASAIDDGKCSTFEDVTTKCKELLQNTYKDGEKSKDNTTCKSFCNELSVKFFGYSLPSQDGYTKLNSSTNYFLIDETKYNISYDELVAYLKLAKPGDVIQYHGYYFNNNGEKKAITHTCTVGELTDNGFYKYEAAKGTSDAYHYYWKKVEFTKDSIESGYNFGKFEKTEDDSFAYGISIYRSKTLYKTYTLRFDANSGVNPPDEMSGSCRYTIPAQEPTREGYTFVGWRTGKTVGVKYSVGEVIELDKDMVLYASWQKNEENPETDSNNNSDNDGLVARLTKFFDEFFPETNTEERIWIIIIDLLINAIMPLLFWI